MEKAKNISLFLLGILVFSIYTSLLKIVHLTSEQLLNIDSINSAIFLYGLTGLFVLILVIYVALYYLKKESLKILDIVILIILLGVLLLVKYYVQKSENLMINNFDLERELRFKLLGIRSYVSIGLKIAFFSILFLKTLKNK